MKGEKVREQIIDELREELDRAYKLHADFPSIHHAHSVIEEEFDEFWEEAKKKIPEAGRMRRELIQTAAMCIRTIYDLELYPTDFMGWTAADFPFTGKIESKRKADVVANAVEFTKVAITDEQRKKNEEASRRHDEAVSLAGRTELRIWQIITPVFDKMP